MVYYDVKIKYELVQNDKKRGFYSDLRAINREQRRSKNTAQKLLFYAFEDNVLSAVLMFDYAKTSLSKAKERFETEIRNQNKNVFSSFHFLKAANEITLETACENIDYGMAVKPWQHFPTCRTTHRRNRRLSAKTCSHTAV